MKDELAAVDGEEAVGEGNGNGGQEVRDPVAPIDSLITVSFVPLEVSSDGPRMQREVLCSPYPKRNFLGNFTGAPSTASGRPI